MAQHQPKSYWVEEFLLYGSSWDDSEDGLTTSRRAVFSRLPEPTVHRERFTPSLPRQDERSRMASALPG
jgi:hypothetical protein